MELPDSIDWPERTREWWAAWVDSPITEDFTQLQWEYLLDTALLHATVWGSGDVAKAAELRTRIERLGGIPAPPSSRPSTAVSVTVTSERKETPLDELARRRAAAGGAGADRPKRSPGKKVAR